MSETLSFKTYCTILYMQKKNISGKEVADLFNKYNVLPYIEKFYGPLHSTSDSYIVDDIDVYIKARTK